MADQSSTSVTLGQGGAVVGTSGQIVVTGSTISLADPIVPADGTQNITGTLTASGAINAGQTLSLGNGSSINNSGAANNFITFGGQTATGFTYNSQVADGATAIGSLFNTSTTISNAAAKLLSVQNNGVEKVYVGFDGSVRTLGALAVGAITAVKSAAYSATVADSLVLADPNAAAGSFAITLPAANAAKGQLLTVKVVAIHATRVVTVIRAGADTIEGVDAAATTLTLTTSAKLASALLQSDGTSKWYLISGNGTIT